MVVAFDEADGPTAPSSDYSVDQRWNGVDINVRSIDFARALLQKSDLRRFGPLAALLNTALRHRVMIVADGEDWQRTHDALMPSFLPAPVTTYAPVVRAVAGEAFAQIAARGQVELAIEPAMRMVLGRVMGHVLFGHVLSVEDAERLESRLDAVTQVIDSGPPARVNRALGGVFRALRLSDRQPIVIPKAQRQAIEALMTWIDGEAQRARGGGSAPLIERLHLRFQALPEARRRRAVAAECAMIFIAGIETTAAALTFAVAELANAPDLLRQATREARALVASPPIGAAAQFPLIHRIIMETLRRHTVVPTFLREAGPDCHVRMAANGGKAQAAVALARGATLRFLSLPGHLRRGVWKKPLAFDPGRFDGTLTAAQKKTYMPFGAGPQSCMGRSLALTESVLVLAALLRHLDLEPGSGARPIRVRRNALFTNRPIGVAVRACAAQANR